MLHRSRIDHRTTFSNLIRQRQIHSNHRQEMKAQLHFHLTNIDDIDVHMHAWTLVIQGKRESK